MGVIYYNLLMKLRVKYKRVNLGNIYLEKTYIIIINNINVNNTWFIKKKGTNCGIIYILFYFSILFYILL